MEGVIQSIMILIISMEFIIGHLTNGFIVLVNFVDWMKRRKLSSVDQILTALAVSRIALLLSTGSSILVSKLDSGGAFAIEILKIFTFAWVVAGHFCMWLTACLGLFYFLKIANFSNSIFLYLRWRVKSVISVIMLVSLLLLILELVLMNSYIYVWVKRYKDSFVNSSSLSDSVEPYRFLLLLSTIFTSIPFTMSQVTFILLIFSLCKHVKKMQDNVQRCRDASTTAHTTALQIMVTSVLLCSIFFLVFLLQLLKSELLTNDLYVSFSQAAAFAFPSLHSCLLILGSMKLRQASRSVWWWLRCRPKDVKPSDL
uniref:taste receptor type 2 member 14-like n=1 Tax=Jaculus jaculus TaxID=51337 RepID=UPI0003331199|nr:taste receptor type 2 member 14-like [Jaculus jaculus]